MTVPVHEDTSARESVETHEDTWVRESVEVHEDNPTQETEEEYEGSSIEDAVKVHNRYSIEETVSEYSKTQQKHSPSAEAEPENVRANEDPSEHSDGILVFSREPSPTDIVLPAEPEQMRVNEGPSKKRKASAPIGTQRNPSPPGSEIICPADPQFPFQRDITREDWTNLMRENSLLKHRIRRLEYDKKCLDGQRFCLSDELSIFKEGNRKIVNELKEVKKERDQIRRELQEVLDEANGLNRLASEVHAEEAAAARAEATVEAAVQANAVDEAAQEEAAEEATIDPTSINKTPAAQTGIFKRVWAHVPSPLSFVGFGARTAPVQRVAVVDQVAPTNTGHGQIRESPTPASPSATRSTSRAQDLASSGTLFVPKALPASSIRKMAPIPSPNRFTSSNPRRRPFQDVREARRKRAQEADEQHRVEQEQRREQEKRREQETEARIQAEEEEQNLEAAIRGATYQTPDRYTHVQKPMTEPRLGQKRKRHGLGTPSKPQTEINELAPQVAAQEAFDQTPGPHAPVQEPMTEPPPGQKRRLLVPVSKLKKIPSHPPGKPNVIQLYYDLPQYHPAETDYGEDMMEVSSDESLISDGDEEREGTNQSGKQNKADEISVTPNENNRTSSTPNEESSSHLEHWDGLPVKGTAFEGLPVGTVVRRFESGKYVEIGPYGEFRAWGPFHEFPRPPNDPRTPLRRNRRQPVESQRAKTTTPIHTPKSFTPQSQPISKPQSTTSQSPQPRSILKKPRLDSSVPDLLTNKPNFEQEKQQKPEQDRVARVRELIETHKPKQPSRLREVSRLSSSPASVVEGEIPAASEVLRNEGLHFIAALAADVGLGLGAHKPAADAVASTSFGRASFKEAFPNTLSLS